MRGNEGIGRRKDRRSVRSKEERGGGGGVRVESAGGGGFGLQR